MILHLTRIRAAAPEQVLLFLLPLYCPMVKLLSAGIFSSITVFQETGLPDSMQMALLMSVLIRVPVRAARAPLDKAAAKKAEPVIFLLIANYSKMTVTGHLISQ